MFRKFKASQIEGRARQVKMAPGRQQKRKTNPGFAGESVVTLGRCPLQVKIWEAQQTVKLKAVETLNRDAY